MAQREQTYWTELQSSSEETSLLAYKYLNEDQTMIWDWHVITVCFTLIEEMCMLY